jgi:hypothetical protein
MWVWPRTVWMLGCFRLNTLAVIVRAPEGDGRRLQAGSGCVVSQFLLTDRSLSGFRPVCHCWRVDFGPRHALSHLHSPISPLYPPSSDMHRMGSVLLRMSRMCVCARCMQSSSGLVSASCTVTAQGISATIVRSTVAGSHSISTKRGMYKCTGAGCAVIQLCWWMYPRGWP